MSQQGSRGSLTWKVVVLVVAVGILIIGIFGIKQWNDTNKQVDRILSGVEGSSASGSQPQALDMFNRDITREDYGRQLDVLLPYLQKQRAESIKEASDELNLQNRVNTLKPSELPADSALRKAQDDQNNITADLWTISSETNTVLARNLLNAVFWNDPASSNDAYDRTAKLIGNGKGKILAPTSVVEVSPIYWNGTVGSTKISGQTTYLVQLASRSADGGKVYEQVISTRRSQDGKSSNPVVVESIQYGESTYVESPSKMPPRG